MQYKHTRFDDSVNVTSSNPFADFISYILTVLLLIAGVYYFSAYLVEFSIPYIDQKMEKRIWSVMFDNYYSAKNKARSEQNIKAEKYLQELLDKIPKDKSEGSDYKVILVDDKNVNAMALPSGKIIVYSGLLEKIKSENGLVFVLGHELGHFAHRDHLRGMGRGVIAGLLLSPLADFSGVGIIIGSFDMYFSREQELQADEYGLQAMNSVYGHAGGAVEFFEYVQENDRETFITKYSSSHPVSKERIENIKSLISAKNMKELATITKKL